jgi:hypothetical protein
MVYPTGPNPKEEAVMELFLAYVILILWILGFWFVGCLTLSLVLLLLVVLAQRWNSRRLRRSRC